MSMNGIWICTDASVETPMFVKRFYANHAKRVTLSISGLGYFFFTINGIRISDDLFTPAHTDYAPRDTAHFLYPIHDRLTHKVFYLTYDLTEYIQNGENVLSVVVGNGWFRQSERIAEGHTDYSDTLCCIFDIQLENHDGSSHILCSDGSEECYVYPILKSNLFLGDMIDTRMFLSPLPQVTTSLFTQCRLGKLLPQNCPKDRVIRHISPISLGNGLYDVGENISGRIKLTVRGQSGDRITIYHSEELKNGALDHGSCGGGYICRSGVHQIQQDCYILNGTEQTLHPEFAWHGFRYFQIEGNCQILSLAAEIIHTDLPITASFHCNDEVINWLYHAFLASLLANFHSSLPSDCPHRERLGYTGDGQVTCLAGMLTLDSQKAYRKWIDDIFDCQCQDSGHVQHTAPFGGGGGGPGGWGGAIVFVPYQYDKVFGDRELLEIAFPKMQKWIDYLEAHCQDDLVVCEEKDGWCLGDWCAVPSPRLPEPFVNTCCMVKALQLMVEIATYLEKDTDTVLSLSAQIIRHKKALYMAYHQNDSYCNGIQGANAYAIWAELFGCDLEQRLTDDYETKTTFDTGFIGTEILCDTLFKIGRGDIAVKLMGSTDPTVGFEFMRRQGATTLYECLDSADCSHNHPMFGGCVQTLFTSLIGIQLSHGKVRLIPVLHSGLTHIEGSIALPQGKISVAITPDTLTLETDFPIEVTLNNHTALTPAGKTVFSIHK